MSSLSSAPPCPPGSPGKRSSICTASQPGILLRRAEPLPAGFTPVEAIHIATQNGALFLGEEPEIGSVAAGKAADLVVIAGNPAQKIDDVENVEIVFKDGIGFDPVKLTQSIVGSVGLR
jgi:predicted amidohydrolase YtcJ